MSGDLFVPAAKPTKAWVLLLPGSGPATLDAAGPSTEFYSTLKKTLLSHGIAILQFDKRGVGRSTGELQSASLYQLAADAREAFSLLRTKAHEAASDAPVGVVGHSEGGMLACELSTHSKVDFLGLLTTPILPGKDFIIAQQAAKAESMGSSDERDLSVAYVEQLIEIIKSEPDNAKATILIRQLRRRIQPHRQANEDRVDEAQFYAQTNYYLSPWTRSVIGAEPATWLRQVDAPKYIIFCEQDVQVPATRHAAYLRESIPDVENAPNRVRMYPLDHFFSAGIDQHAVETRDKLILEFTEWLIHLPKGK